MFIPDISNLDTGEVTNMSMSKLFEGCNPLISLPDISKWNTKKVICTSLMFCKCES